MAEAREIVDAVLARMESAGSEVSNDSVKLDAKGLGKAISEQLDNYKGSAGRRVMLNDGEPLETFVEVLASWAGGAHPVMIRAGISQDTLSTLADLLDRGKTGGFVLPGHSLKPPFTRANVTSRNS